MKSVLYLLLPFILISCNEQAKKEEISGKVLYSKYCTACHGIDGKKGLANAADLSISTLAKIDQRKVIVEGKGTMVPFKQTLTNNQIDSIVAYIQLLKI